MNKNFEELDFQKTPMGDISLRRRKILQLGGVEVFEVKLGEEYLMSSLFHDVEVALAKLGLAQLNSNEIDVVVGGLGLGYTAVSALENTKVRSLVVVETLEAVIGWHRKGLVPLGTKLMSDNRCRINHADFFALAESPEQGFDPLSAGRRFHAILLDIDHSPRKLLNTRHGAFYEKAGLQKLVLHLHQGGVFALWSDDPPDDIFMIALKQVFASCEAHVVSFNNPLLKQEGSNTVYVAIK